MIKQIIKLIVSFFSLFYFVSVCADSAANQLTELLTKINTLQANFSQTVYDHSQHVLQQTKGQINLQRPGKFRWEIKNPGKQLLIADGTQIWFYDVDLAQVMIQPQNSAAKGSPGMLLSGPVVKLVQDFTITQSEPSSSEQLNFKLFPKTKNNLFRSIELGFAQDKLATMKLTDNFGQQTNIKFSKVRYNSMLNAELFNFSVPKGVSVVKQ